MAAADASDPGDAGRSLAVELLLPVWQRSEEGAIQRAAGDASLLRLEMPLEAMTEQLPRLKADGIAGGETVALLSGLDVLATRGWKISIAKDEPVRFLPRP